MSFSDEYIRGKTCSSLSILTNCVAALGKPRFGGYRSGMRYTFEIGIVAAYVCMPVVGEFILEGPVGTPSSNRSEAWPPPRAGFWIRLFAGMIDLTLLVVPFAVFVSFFAAGMGISNPFFNHRSGTPLNDTLTQSGPTFLLICLAFFAAESWLYFAISESSA